MNPLISIVIPTYNEERDLVACLESIALQNFNKRKIEVIIVDNYSKDNTVKIAREFSKKINLRVLFNKIKDAEVSKMIGFRNSKAELFMYLDADMVFADKEFIEKMTKPLIEDKNIAGVFVRFLVNKKHHPLTRTLSYDPWQRDPIFRFFTVSPEEIITQNKDGYFICDLERNKIPPQGLMIYRRKKLVPYIKNKKQLIDNDIPVALFNLGNKRFAYVPQTGVYHYLLRSLQELSKKRMRNLARTYFPNQDQRLFKWINWKNDWPKAIIWTIYTSSFVLPIINATYKTLKYRDLCFLNEPAINLVSTYSIIFAVLKNAKNKI